MLRRLLGYAAYMFGANTLTGLLTFIVSAFGMVSRSKDAFGDYALYMRIYEIGQGLFIFGANASIQRYAADDLENRRRFSAIALWLFLGLLGVMGAVGIVVAIAFGFQLSLAVFGLPFLVLYWWGRYIVRSNLDARREARLMMVASLSNSLFQLAFLSLTDFRDALIYGDAAALFASGLAGLVAIRNGSGLGVRAILATRVPKAFLREAIRFGGPVWWSGQIFQLKHQLQAVWTNARLGRAELGALQGMMTMWQFSTKPLEYLSQAALPGLVAAKDERSKLYQEVLRFCLVSFTLVGIAVAAGIPLVFEVIDFVAGLLGRGGADSIRVKYAEVPQLLRMLALMLPVSAFEVVTNPLSVASGRPRAVLYSNLANVGLVLSALYFLSRWYGLVGVVAAGLIGSIVSASAYAIVLRRDYPEEIASGVRAVLKTMGCAAAALAPVQIFADRAWSWMVAFPAALIFVGGLVALRVIDTEDIRRAWSAARAQRPEQAARKPDAGVEP